MVDVKLQGICRVLDEDVVIIAVSLRVRVNAHGLRLSLGFN